MSSVKHVRVALSFFFPEQESPFYLHNNDLKEGGSEANIAKANKRDTNVLNDYSSYDLNRGSQLESDEGFYLHGPYKSEKADKLKTLFYRLDKSIRVGEDDADPNGKTGERNALLLVFRSL